MERITKRLSLSLKCRKCKEYKRTTRHLIQIIQDQNKKLENLQRQLDFINVKYLQQNQRLSRTQATFLCNPCLAKHNQDDNVELCTRCSLALPK